MPDPAKSPASSQRPINPAQAGRMLGRFLGRQLQTDVVKRRKQEIVGRLKPLGMTIDRIVTLMVVAIVISYGVRLLFYVLTR
jgi:hypothetical protein